MPDSKLVYVNDNTDSDEELIYGEDKNVESAQVAMESPDTRCGGGDEASVSDTGADTDSSTVNDTISAAEETQGSEETTDFIEVVTSSVEKEKEEANVVEEEELNDTEQTGGKVKDTTNGNEEDNENKEPEDRKDNESGDKAAEEYEDDEDADDKNADDEDADDEDADDTDSIDTQAILNVDPLYFRLTKFLQTGGDEPENVAEILKKINQNLNTLNQNILKYLEK